MRRWAMEWFLTEKRDSEKRKITSMFPLTMAMIWVVSIIFLQVSSSCLSFRQDTIILLGRK